MTLAAELLLALGALAVPALAQGTAGGPATEPERDPAPPPAPTAAQLARLRELMLAGLGTLEPNASLHRGEGPSPFDGSYDWHSSVIAHWALLVLARTEGDAALERTLLERLGPDALRAERARLAALEERAFTFPYDEAWLAMLLAELDRREAVDDALLRPFRREVEERLVDWLVASPFPERVPPPEAGGKPFNGFYRSWLLAWLLLRWSDPLTPRLSAGLDDLFAERVEPHRAAIAAQTEPHPFDFVSVPAVLALADDARGVEPTWTPGPPAALPATVKLSTVHVLGLELSRLWPNAARAAADPTARARWHARLARYLEREDLWAQDFPVVTHWIPQFVWIGVWLERGRP